jgi:hypothetical protein
LENELSEGQNNTVPGRFETPLPRYSLLTLCIRAALLGAQHPLVQHMARRNHELDEMRAMEQALA